MVLLYNVLYHCLKDISPSVGEGHTIKFNTVQSNFRSGRLDGCWDQEGGNGNATLHNYQWNELRAPFLCAARCILVGSLSCLLLRSVDVTLALLYDNGESKDVKLFVLPHRQQRKNMHSYGSLPGLEPLLAS